MPEVTRTPVRQSAADIWRVSRRTTGAGQLGLMNSCVSCRSRMRKSRATVSIRSSGSAKRLTSGLVFRESVSAILASSSAPALWSRTGSSSCGICRVFRLEPCREGISLRLGQMQVMLGSAQQYVISRAGPFVCHEIADFRFIEQPAMVPAQAVKIGSRPYKVARTGAVQSAIVMDKCAWHPRPGLAQAIGESFIVSVRHVAAGQRRAFRPVFAHARENVLQPVQA